MFIFSSNVVFCNWYICARVFSTFIQQKRFVFFWFAVPRDESDGTVHPLAVHKKRSDPSIKSLDSRKSATPLYPILIRNRWTFYIKACGSWKVLPSWHTLPLNAVPQAGAWLQPPRKRRPRRRAEASRHSLPTRYINPAARHVSFFLSPLLADDG